MTCSKSRQSFSFAVAVHAAIALSCLTVNAAQAQKPVKFSDAIPELSKLRKDAFRTPDAKPGMRVLKPYSEASLSKILNERVETIEGVDRLSFDAFGDKVLAGTSADLSAGIYMTTNNAEIKRHILFPAYPKKYWPTVKEYLDLIALQCGARWSYDRNNQYVPDNQAFRQLADQYARFDFVPGAAAPSYTITLPSGWLAAPKSYGISYGGKDYMQALEIYELGAMSPENAKDAAYVKGDFAKDVLALWTEGLKPLSEVKRVKVGAYDGYVFESIIDKRSGKIYYKQWLFVAGNKAYTAISRMPEERKAAVLPGAERALASFKLK
jgi:hypothetical protein